ncbi:MAG: GIY-YIG nuclease family protein [Pikeienuella sp.]
MHGPGVYIIQEGDAGPVKIGVAMHPARRLIQLKSGNPRRLFLRKIFVVDTEIEQHEARRFCNALERHVLSDLSVKSISGEWLDASVDEIVKSVRKFIKSGENADG